MKICGELNDLKPYYNDISKYKPLTKEEEMKVGKRVRRGDSKAKDKLVVSNLKFVVDVAKKYYNSGVPFPDLIAEGNIGLIRAADKFDERKGYKFISYAVWWIRQSIQEYIKSRGINTFVSLPETSVGETMCEDSESVETVNKNECLFSDIEESYDKDVIDDQKRIISKLLDNLDDRERNIISDYFGLDDTEELTLNEIGQKYHLTNERVRQIKEKALRKMRSEALLVSDFSKILL